MNDEPVLDNSLDNPQAVTSEQQAADQGFSDDEKAQIVGLIQTYRKQWAQDRMLRFPSWLKNIQMYKGIQVLGWDPGSNTYFDALGWYRQQGNNDGADDTYLEKYINNITQMFGTGFVAALSRGVPPTLVRPENAEDLKDTTTAKASQEAIGIIERLNRIRSLVRREDLLLYLYGVYFKHTRFVIDGNWAGYHEVPTMVEQEVQIPDRFHCSACGANSPTTAVDLDDPKCVCGASFGAADYYEGGSEMQMVPAIEKKPKGMVKWSVYGPMQIDADPKAQEIGDTPILVKEVEVDVGALRMTFPLEAEKITEGAESATNQNASYERLVRTMVHSKVGNTTSDISAQNPTYVEAWVQPQAYYRLACDAKDPNSLLAKLLKQFPQGFKVGMCGPTVLQIKAAQLTKEWTCCLLHEECGLYPPSVADNVVPFNERFNDESNIIDDYMERCSTGVTLADGRRLDLRKLNGKRQLPGVWNDVPTKSEAGDMPLANALYQFQYAMEPRAFDYLQMLLSFAQSICGITPEVFGTGTHQGVETAKGQAQMLDQANAKLGIYWENLKEEHACASQNAIECLQQNMALAGDMWSVIEENGSEFRNNYVRMEEMQGRVRVYPDIDQGLPQSPEQIREWWQNVIDKMGENQLYGEFMQVPVNQEMAITVLGVQGVVMPGGAQRSKTLQDISRLLKEPGVPIMGVEPNTGQPGVVSIDPPVKPSKRFTNYVVAKSTMELFCQENCDLETDNPQGWTNLGLYYDLLEQYEMERAATSAQRKAKVTQAGNPAPPPDSKMQQAQQSLMQDAAAAAQALTNIATAPPLPKGVGTANVSAGKELIDAAVKASGGK
jgi:hypothetical protein